MRNLLNFLLRYSSWMLFWLYVVLSCVMLFNSNPYQHYVYLTSANGIASTVYGISNNVTSYFNLRDINEDLQVRNAQLEKDLLALRQQLMARDEMGRTDSIRVDSALVRYDFIIAHVINNSINRSHNYITIQKGSLDGVRPEMGVVDQNGVVGVVNLVGPHTARVISFLNPHLPLSCKVKGNEHFGSLVWDGKDSRTALLEELPRHAMVKRGDTIVTSGYSSIFPEGIPVGTVLETVKDTDGSFSSLRVRLFTDFSTLSTVRVIKDALKEELITVEKDIDEEGDK